MHRMTFNFVLRTLLVVGVVCGGGVVDAKTKKMDKDVVKIATELAKDREAAFAGQEAMPVTEFQEKWTALAKQIDDLYLGHSVELKKFGPDVGTRKVFTHLIYMGLRVNQQTHLTPVPGALVSRHPFLQELVVDGACYTGGDTFPKKMRDLLKPQLDIQVVLREHLEAWDEDYRKKFEKEFGKPE